MNIYFGEIIIWSLYSRALQEAQDIFGVDFDYDEFDKYGEEDYDEEDEDEDEYADEDEDTERR